MKANTQNLQWVSEWRITPETDSDYFKFKISNGGVYTSATDLNKAKQTLIGNIEREKQQYLINSFICPNCQKEIHEHSMVDFQNCLIALAVYYEG